MNITPPALRPSDGAVAASIVLGVVIGLIWVLHLATVASLGGSDAAGNGIAEAYAAIQLIALWLLLTIMTVIASAKGAAPKPATVAALVIVPVSGFVAMAAAGECLSGFARQSRDAGDADGASRAAVTKDHTGSAIEYFTWLNAKLDSIEAMPSSRVSLFFKNASYDDRSAATTRNR